MRGENISLRTLIIIFSLFLIFATRVETIFNLSPRILQFIFHKTGQSESGLDTKNKLKKKLSLIEWVRSLTSFSLGITHNHTGCLH